jgi:hypothetical protein
LVGLIFVSTPTHQLVDTANCKIRVLAFRFYQRLLPLSTCKNFYFFKFFKIILLRAKVKFGLN